MLNPARILPPIQVEYLRSGGAYIFILMSLRANFFTSFNKRSPNPSKPVKSLFHQWDSEHRPRHKVLPPLSTTFENKLFRRSRSTRFIESTTTWCTPAYSCPISSGLKRISGARKRSGPSCIQATSHCVFVHDIEHAPALHSHLVDGTPPYALRTPSPPSTGEARHSSIFLLSYELPHALRLCVGGAPICVTVVVGDLSHLCVRLRQKRRGDMLEVEHIPPSNINSSYRVRHRETFKYRDCMCNAVSRVQYDAGSPPRRVSVTHSIAH